jgi:hypothetical protein
MIRFANWYNLGAGLLVLGVAFGALGYNDVAAFLIIAAVACAILDIGLG